MNIQFIAKNNDIKVIECNVRASRSFPFVSKVLGLDLVEIATRVMMGQTVEPIPRTIPRKDHVAIKVPQFSFSRLAGADPILGVEMASTGEVACFGKNKYEAYLKALISTGFRLPKKNILLSIGSFKEKQEFLPCVEKLHKMGYSLFATAGTADFIQEHGFPVKYLETIEDDGDVPLQKLEYSLNQHLSNNLIDLYVNLPSKNRYKRPASYMSRGYRTRRLAIDFAIPLITNIKCAKLFVEAMSRVKDFDISSTDYITSYKTETLPGLINIHNLLATTAEKYSDLTKSALAGGFTMLCNLPYSDSITVHDSKTLKTALKACEKESYCDFSMSLATSTDNDDEDLNVLMKNVTSVHLMNNLTKTISHKLKKLFDDLPSTIPIVANASYENLSSVLLLSTLYNRPIHITGVHTREEIELIALSKEKGCSITCDVNVYNLFLNKEEAKCKLFGTQDDVDALWTNLSVIDCFSIGEIPFKFHKERTGIEVSAFGYQEILPLLLNSVYEGRLTMKDIKEKFYDNPRHIFDIPEQTETCIEVEMDRKFVVSKKGFNHSLSNFSPFEGRELMGCVHRVILRGETVYLDGNFLGKPIGRDMTSVIQMINTNLQQHVIPPSRNRLDSLRIAPVPLITIDTAIVEVPQKVRKVDSKSALESPTAGRRDSIMPQALLDNISEPLLK